MSAFPTDSSRIDELRRRMPGKGLFAEKDWLASPTAFPLTEDQIDYLEKLGPRLLAFQKASNLFYRQSRLGKMPSYIHQWLDAGKPHDLLEIANDRELKNDLSAVIRPDLLITEKGFALSEMDSVPGGIGLTAWLNQSYAALGENVIGGAEDMREAALRLLPEGDVVIAEEALAYRPEMEWLFGEDRVKAAEGYSFSDRSVYRFFEAFDWPGLASIRESYRPGMALTPPLKPFLEEKLWMALFWLKPLREAWRRELGDRYDRDFQQLIPYSWGVNPEPLPPTAVLPHLNAHSWEEVAAFSQKERDLILKISGYSPLAWGSRGVTLGSDVSTLEWTEKLQYALNSFGQSPYLMQRYEKPALVRHSFWDEKAGETREMQGRVRLCPYYFVEEGEARLKGVLATICPADKKLIHGMKDAIIVPCRLKYK
jgi:hypothetical protein